jgi:hypothetical protein
MSEAIERHEGGQLEYAMSVENVMAQVRAIQELMRQAMKPGEHYGIIPGTSRKDKDGKEMAKPSLLKPGAEKLSMMFRLSPTYTGQECPVVYPGGHLEYRITCTMTNIRTGEVWGQGVGSCSSMETKYRFRNQKTDTGEPIPADYKANKGHYRAQGFVAAKDENDQWIWAKLERVEHDNPADYYNTILKMAKKRAQVDAVLTCTAASDFFTQDLEDMAENGLIDEPAKKDSPKADAPKTPTTASQQPAAAASVKSAAPTPKPGETEPPDEAGTPVEDVFARLDKALAEFCDGDGDKMQDKLMALTSFPGKDKETGKPTGKIVPGVKYVSDLRMKNSEVRARIALDKLTDEMNGER